MKDDICQYMRHLIAIRIQSILNAINYAVTGSNNNAECFHTLRKEVRALRALLIFIKPLDPEQRLYLMRIKLRDWFRTGDVRRDLDVLSGRWEIFREELPDAGADSFLSKYFHTRILSIRDAASAADLNAVLTEIRKAMAGGDWCKEKISCLDFAKKRFRKLDGAARKAGSSLDAMDKKELHALRIKCKNIRYAMEAFLPLWQGKAAEKLFKTLKNLQDILGRIHDIDNTPNVIAGVMRNEDPAAEFEIGFLRGRQSAERADCILLLEREWKRYRKAVSPWNNKA